MKTARLTGIGLSAVAVAAAFLAAGCASPVLGKALPGKCQIFAVGQPLDNELNLSFPERCDYPVVAAADVSSAVIPGYSHWVYGNVVTGPYYSRIIESHIDGWAQWGCDVLEPHHSIVWGRVKLVTPKVTVWIRAHPRLIRDHQWYFYPECNIPNAPARVKVRHQRSNRGRTTHHRKPKPQTLTPAQLLANAGYYDCGSPTTFGNIWQCWDKTHTHQHDACIKNGHVQRLGKAVTCFS